MGDNTETYQSSSEIARIRNRYYVHSILNGVSFRLLAGNIITLYVLNLGADNTLVGLLSSFIHIAMLFLLVGRPLVNRYGAVRVQSVFWFLRYVMMIPVVLTVLPGISANRDLTFALIAIGVFGFHSAKGVALAGQQIILGSVVGEKGRGAVLSRIQTQNTTVSTIAWLLVGFALSRDPSRLVYAATFIIGIVAGFGSSAALSTLPEPTTNTAETRAPFLRSARAGFSNPQFRTLMGILFTKNIFLGMTGAFLIVQFKTVYGHSDASIVFITLIGSMGVIAMAAAAGLLMDRVGAKPLYFAFAAIAAVSVLPTVFGPVGASILLMWLIPSSVFFLYNVGANGMMNCSQDYFFAAIGPNERLNLGIVYNITAGVAGFIGSVGGGLILDAVVTRSGLVPATGFRVYFGMMFAALLGVSYLVTRLPDIGAYSIMNTISVLFSPRDLRSIRILRHLGKTRSVEDEQRIIRALGRTPSAMAIDDLLTKLKSPSFSVRSEALTALRLHPVNHVVAKALIHEVLEHHFTTAYMAAETIGAKRIHEAVPALRAALDSEDFMLCGKAMVALAELKDRESLGKIRELFATSINPRVIIHCARSFTVFKDTDSVSVLIEKLEPRIAPFVRDEIVLAVADILGIGSEFYPLYVLFTERHLAGTAELLDRVNGAPPDFRLIVQETTGEANIFASTARRVFSAHPITAPSIDLSGVIMSALENETILGLVRFRFLVAAIAVLLRER